MDNLLDKNWYRLLSSHIKTNEFSIFFSSLKKEYRHKNIFPEYSKLFSAFNLTPFNKVKVIIIGQDPYYKNGQANGLAFSVSKNVKVPPSLKNIFKEIQDDLKIKKDWENGNLDSWAKQGILLLNSSLSVEENKPSSHSKRSWHLLTDNVIKEISKRKEHCVFILWGAHAKSKSRLIDENRHLILESSHPSPLSAYRGFFGCKHFSKTNNYLKKYYGATINW